MAQSPETSSLELDSLAPLDVTAGGTIREPGATAGGAADRPPAAADNGAPGPVSRATEVARRLRVLLHMQPLFRLHKGDAKRAPETRHYDSLALSLQLFDELLDRMGLGNEVDERMLTNALEPVLTAMDRAAEQTVDRARHARMIDHIVAGLRNDGNARRMFREDYVAIDEEGLAHRRALEFRLLTEVFHPAGGTVLRLSDQACNLYLRLLDLDIEDAQAAAEAVVESQLGRGRFNEAVHSARQARIQSVRLFDKLQYILNATRRDVDRVDWRCEVPAMLDDANGHLERRLRVEAGILDTAQARLEQLKNDARGRRAVVEVIGLIRDCQARHFDLHDHLMRARNVFLEAQARQSFVSHAVLLPDFMSEVLAPLMAQPTVRVVSIIDRSVPLLIGARPPKLINLCALTAWMLRPRKAQARREVPVEPVDPAQLSEEQGRYSDAERQFCTDLLDEFGRRDEYSTLSQLLAEARERGASDNEIELLGLLCLRAFANEDRVPGGVEVEPAAGRYVDDSWLFGEELVLTGSDHTQEDRGS